MTPATALMIGETDAPRQGTLGVGITGVLAGGAAGVRRHS